MEKPRINLLYYKSIVDRCISRFIEEHDSDFTRQENGEYVFSNGVSEQTLKKIFLGYVKDELGQIVSGYKNSSPEFYFILGSCFPGENILLEFGGRAPKLRKLIEIIPDVTYFLKESDIRMDMRMVNSALDGIFSKFMKEKRKTWPNVFFLRHRKVDCYMLYRFIKNTYGSMAVNVGKRFYSGGDRAIFSINDDIDKICPFKDDYIKRGFFKNIENEVYQYIDTCLNGDM